MTTVVFPSAGPDLDGVACAVAYAELLATTRAERVLAAAFATPDPEASYLISRFEGAGLVLDPKLESHDRLELIYVDASSLRGFPDSLDPALVTEVIDHRLHGNPSSEFPAAVVSIELVGAAATLIAERVADAGHTPSEAAAAMLFGAIHSNTQRLRGAVTTARDRASALWLEEFIADPEELLGEQFQARRSYITENLNQSISDEAKQYVHAQTEYEICQLELTGAEEWFERNLEDICSKIAGRRLPSMLNVVDVETARSVLYVPSEQLRSLLSDEANVQFIGERAIFDPAILRKQIVDAIEGLRSLPSKGNSNGR